MWRDQLLNVCDDFGQLYRPEANLNDLPQILPRFFVPPLEDKPQNPILEVLNLESITSNLPPRLFQAHPLPQGLADLSLHVTQQRPETKVEDIWTKALIRNRGDRVRFIYVSSFCFLDRVTIAEWFIVMGSIAAHALK